MPPTPPKRPIRLGVTVGDPAGIGPEIILKSLLGVGEGSGESILRRAEVVLIGPAWVFRDVARQHGFRIQFTTDGAEGADDEGEDSPTEPGRPSEPEGLEKADAAAGPRNPVTGLESRHGEDWVRLPVRVPEGCEVRFEIPYGKEDPLCGAMALRAIEEAVRMVSSGEIDAIVTAPISKAAIHAAGSPFPGHTEMLRSLSRSPGVGMMLVGGGLRVSLVTIHEAYTAVPKLLTKERVVGMIEMTHGFLRQWGIAEPRLALAALNPHAGEGGLFGDEEARILVPAVQAARDGGIAVEGPFPADTVFHLALEGQFDAVVALYHDQALIPIKTLDFHGGVNVTMGLPFVRTSPDHGTAYAIAGRGIARASSMRNALRLAMELAERRRKDAG